jgi:excisionase family DNA binding protein
MNPHLNDKPLPIKEAAELLGLPYWKLQRAVKRGEVPFYTFYNSRKLVRPSEVVDVIERTREGGATEAAHTPSPKVPPKEIQA